MIEQALIRSGITKIAGVDEAGRGPCAGPLIVAAVILEDPFSPALSQVRDSKELTQSKREDLYEVVLKNAISHSIIEVPVEEIDQYGVHKCNIEAVSYTHLTLPTNREV